MGNIKKEIIGKLIMQKQNIDLWSSQLQLLNKLADDNYKVKNKEQVEAFEVCIKHVENKLIGHYNKLAKLQKMC